MKLTKILLLFMLSVGGIIVAVNESRPEVSAKAEDKFCTRYCHNVRCVHYEKKYFEGKISPRLQRRYAANIKWLKNHPFESAYRQNNLLIYVLLVPAGIVFLTWTLVRKGGEND